MSITVVDSIMGSGKSTWIINYMNDHPEKRYIYVTPYLEECSRVADACSRLHFWQPKEPNKQISFLEGIKNKRNISTTHSLFQQLKLSPELIVEIKEMHYTVILDEVVETVQPFSGLRKTDYLLLLSSEWISVSDNGAVSLTERGESVSETKFQEALNFIRAGSVFLYKEMLLLWVLPPETLKLSDDIYIMTYMFEGSHLMHTLKMYGYSYQISHIEQNPYRLIPGPDVNAAERKKELDQMIHILEDEKWNSIGESVYQKKHREYVFSSGWWDKASPANKENVAKKIRNYFSYKAVGYRLDAHSCMWSIIGQTENTERKNRRILVKDYDSCCVAFNKRATNKYADVTALAAFFNVYEHPIVKEWFESNNEIIDNDKYALAILLQWIWRSAIRNNQEIHLYLPSERMRNLLIGWLRSD